MGACKQVRAYKLDFLLCLFLLFQIFFLFVYMGGRRGREGVGLCKKGGNFVMRINSLSFSTQREIKYKTFSVFLSQVFFFVSSAVSFFSKSGGESVWEVGKGNFRNRLRVFFPVVDTITEVKKMGGGEEEKIGCMIKLHFNT